MRPPRSRWPPRWGRFGSKRAIGFRRWSRRPRPIWLASPGGIKSSLIKVLGWHRPLVAGPAVSPWVVPTKPNMAVTEDAQGQATAGEEMTVGWRVHTVRHGQGSPAGTARLETAGVGVTGVTAYGADRTPARGR